MKEQSKSNPSSAAVYMHFKHQNYRAIRMFLTEDGSKFEVQRMCPLGLVQFFFTYTPGSGKRYPTISSSFQSRETNLQLDYYIGKIDVQDIIKEMNYMLITYNEAPLDDNFQPNIDLQPRAAEVGVIYFL